jgi:hypothetical protein
MAHLKLSMMVLQLLYAAFMMPEIKGISLAELSKILIKQKPSDGK